MTREVSYAVSILSCCSIDHHNIPGSPRPSGLPPGATRELDAMQVFLHLRRWYDARHDALKLISPRVEDSCHERIDDRR